MTDRIFSDALNHLDDDLLAETDARRETRPAKSRRKAWPMALAACLCLAVALAALSPALFGSRQTDGDLSDTSYHAFFINGFLYIPVSESDGSLARYPLLRELMEDGITADDLGEVMGTLPAAETLKLPEATVYRCAVYPDYDAVCIIRWNWDWGAEYALFLSDGMALSDEVGTDTGSIFALHGMPGSILQASFRRGETVLDDGETLSALIALLSGKEALEDSVLLDQRWVQLWQDTYGTDDVFFDGTSIQYADAETRHQFSELVNAVMEDLWFSTDKGFDSLLILYYPQVAYFSFCGHDYLLTEAEVAQLDRLLGLA